MNIIIDETPYAFLDSVGRQVADSVSLNDLIKESSSSDRYNADIIQLWMVPQYNLEIKSHCSASIFDVFELNLVQPCYQLAGTDYKVCSRCSAFLSDEMFTQHNELSLRSFQCDIFKLIDAEDFLPYVVAEQLIMEKMDYAADDDSEQQVGGDLPSPLLLCLKRLAFNNALDQLRDWHTRGECNPERLEYLEGKIEKFRSRIEKSADQVMLYEDAEQQQIARQYVDYDRVLEYAEEFCGMEVATMTSTAKELQVIHEKSVFMGLMRWFKHDFFEWCNKPGCCNHSCSKHLQTSQMNKLPEMGTPSPDEISLGSASRVELYRCEACEETTRFARYNNPAYLLHPSNRRGRCGEFANAFCLILRSLHFDARYVLDFTDHVWVEVWMPSLQRFVHMDPCEVAFDKPLLYEAGWNKNLTHVISFSRYGVVDVLPRYSRMQEEVYLRRHEEEVPEFAVDQAIEEFHNNNCSAFHMTRDQTQMEKQQTPLPWDTALTSTDGSFLSNPMVAMIAAGRQGVERLNGCDISVEVMQTRHRQLLREMEGMQFMDHYVVSEEEKKGRISGGSEWGVSRGETVDYSLAQKFIPSEVTKLTFPSYDSTGLIRDNSVLRHGVQSSFKSSLSTSETAVYPDQTSFHMKLFPVLRETVTTPHSDALPGVNYVTIIRNDTLSSHTKPMFTSDFLTVQQQPSTEPPVVQQLRVLDGYICSSFSSLVYPPSSVDINTWLSAMTERCLEDKNTLGLTIISRPDGLLSHILLFENSGYPLLQAALKRADGAEATGSNAKTMVKYNVGATINDPCASAVSRSVEVKGTTSDVQSRRSYYYLGGGHHGDTSSFDSSEFPISLLKSFPAEVQLVLKQIIVYAGVELVNGVQCEFDVLDARTGELLHPGLTFKSPTFTSTSDDPQAFVWTINDSSVYPPKSLKGHSFDRITSIVVKHGALIDSITIETLHKKKFRAGGDGGGSTTKLEVPDNCNVCGFFGGLGGHLHNLGVVLWEGGVGVDVKTGNAGRPVLAVPVLHSLTPVDRDMFVQLLLLFEKHSVWDFGLLHHHSMLHRGLNRPILTGNVHSSSLSDAGMFLDILITVLTKSSLSKLTVYFTKTLMYMNFIKSSPHNVQFQKAYLHYSCIQTNVASVPGGIDLICFGPFSYSTLPYAPVDGDTSNYNSEIGHYVYCRVHELVKPSSGNRVSEAQVVGWLDQYFGFLEDLSQSLSTMKAQE